jgi:NADPH2:quinone reductase
MPPVMKTWAITCTPAPGTLGDALNIVERNVPVAGPGEILVKNKVVGIAIDDIRIAEDRFMPLVKANPSNEVPYVPGHECGGIVEAIGDGVTAFKVDDLVYGTTDHCNGWAEYSVLKASFAGKVPEGWTIDKAVAYITGAAVGGAAVDYIAADASSDKVAVVVGASGSIGSAVLQWLVLEKKIQVMGVCSSQKASLVKDLGAETVLEYTRGPWEEQLPEGTPKVDYVFDFVGGTRVEKAAKTILKKDGIFITAVGPNDKPGEGVGWGGLIGMAFKMIWRQIQWDGSWKMAVQADPSDNSTPKLGLQIQPLVDMCVKDGWNKAAVKEAIKRVDSRRAAGRVLLRLSE